MQLKELHRAARNTFWKCTQLFGGGSLKGDSNNNIHICYMSNLRKSKQFNFVRLLKQWAINIQHFGGILIDFSYGRRFRRGRWRRGRRHSGRWAGRCIILKNSWETTTTRLSLKRTVRSKRAMAEKNRNNLIFNAYPKKSLSLYEEIDPAITQCVKLPMRWALSSIKAPVDDDGPDSQAVFEAKRSPKWTHLRRLFSSVACSAGISSFIGFRLAKITEEGGAGIRINELEW